MNDRYITIKQDFEKQGKKWGPEETKQSATLK